MPRPSRLVDQRRQLAPVVARAFAELGYRGATTAQLARRCRVQENILYRLWPDKRAMFIAALEYVYDLSERTWMQLAGDGPAGGQSGTAAQRVLAHESEKHGQFGHYRLVFAGLNEADDPQIRAALSRMFERFVRLLERYIREHRHGADRRPEPHIAAWAVVGLGTAANIIRELHLLDEPQRQRLIADVGRILLEGVAP